MDSETLGEHYLQQLRPGPRRSVYTESRTHPHRRQHRDQVLRQAGKTLDKMAFSFTGDLGCEFGPSTALWQVSVATGTRDPLRSECHFPHGGIDPKQSFIGYMLYDRTWFKKDMYGSDDRRRRRSTIPGAILSCSRRSMARPRLRRRSMLHTLPAIPAIHSRPGIRRSPTTTCRGNGSRSAGNTTIATPVCPIGRARAELRRRVQAECLTPTTDLLNFLLATTAIRREHLTLSGAQTACACAGQQRLVSRSAPRRAI